MKTMSNKREQLILKALKYFCGIALLSGNLCQIMGLLGFYEPENPNLKYLVKK